MTNEEFFLNSIHASRKAWTNALRRGIDPLKAFDAIATEFISKQGMSLKMAKTLAHIGLLFAAMQCARNDRERNSASQLLLAVANQVGSD